VSVLCNTILQQEVPQPALRDAVCFRYVWVCARFVLPGADVPFPITILFRFSCT
jgi:hypothetical protein